jgi:hypothetical protein
MPEISDVMRMSEDSTLPGGIPDVESPEGLKAAAELVYRSLHARPNCPERMRDGKPGKLWQGRIQKEVLYILWPSLDDRMILERDASKRITKKLFEYLSESGAVVGLQRTHGINAAVWWVSNHWTPLERRTIQEAPAETTEGNADPFGFACRVPNCNAVSGGIAGRGVHEFHTHRIAVAADGTILSYDAEDFTPAYRMETVLHAMEGAPGFLAISSVHALAHGTDPRMGQKFTKDALGALVAQGRVYSEQRGTRVLFCVPQTPETASDAKDTPETVGIPEGAPMPESIMESDADWSATGSAQFIQRNLTRATKAVGELAAHAEELERRLAEVQQELKVTKVKLVSSKSCADPEKTELRRTVGHLTEKLAEAVQERDEYKQQLESIQRAISGFKPTK